MRCRRCDGAGRRRGPPAQRGVLQGLLPRGVPRAGASARSAEYDMIAPSDRVLVAVSGGKDSLALWDVLLDLGYDATGLYLGLGIGEYSDRSRDVDARRSPRARGAELRSGRSRATTTATTSRRPGGGARDRRVRSAACRSATSSTKRGARRRLRRRGDRPQPRRRGGHAARQHAAVEDRVHRAAVAGAAGPGRHGEEGEAAVPAVRARDGRVRVPAAASTTSSRSVRSSPATRSSATRRR